MLGRAPRYLNGVHFVLFPPFVQNLIIWLDVVSCNAREIYSIMTTVTVPVLTVSSSVKPVTMSKPICSLRFCYIYTSRFDLFWFELWVCELSFSYVGI